MHALRLPARRDDGQDAAFRGELLRRYQSLRRFLPALLEVVSFEPPRPARPVLDALESLRALEGRPGRVSASSVSLKVVTGRWRRLVLANPQLGDGRARPPRLLLLRARGAGRGAGSPRRVRHALRALHRPARQAAQRPRVDGRAARDLRRPQPRPRPAAGARAARRPAGQRLPADRRAPATRTSRSRSPRSPAPTAPTSASSRRSTSPSS